MEIITGFAGAALVGMVAKGIHIRRKINRFNKELENYLEQEAPQSIRDYFHRGVINTEDITQSRKNSCPPMNAQQIKTCQNCIFSYATR